MNPYLGLYVFFCDFVFHSPEEMADSLLRNWRWQWFYKNRKLLGCQDFENICNLDNKIPDLLQEEYRQSIQILQNKIHIVVTRMDTRNERITEEKS